MKICGFQKLTLLDFPGRTACTIFTGGCNMRCPFCHNSSLVTGTCAEVHSEEEVLAFLEKRQGLLDGVAVTGGEPLLQKDIAGFLERVKALGYAVKLDTNGSFPDRLISLIEKGLVDFIAMDIKNTPEKYSLTAGTEIDTDKIKKSVDIIKSSGLEHEFRTTVTAQHHTEEDIINIARWLGKNEKYYLQQFKDSGEILSEGICAHGEDMLRRTAERAAEHVLLCETRGI